MQLAIITGTKAKTGYIVSISFFAASVTTTSTTTSSNFLGLIRVVHLVKSMKANETVAPMLKLIIRMWPHMLVGAHP